MSFINEALTFSCPKCGNISKKNIKLYNVNLRKQNFGISPILPTCLICGSEIALNRSNSYNSDSKVIVLIGTCASGKSSTAEVFMEEYGFAAIDGDCVMQVVKYKLGVNKIEYNETAMYEEIAKQIDILLSFKKDIVISHIITQEDIHIYREMFKQRNLNYKIFLLQPTYDAVLERSKMRTCHKSITPEKWVKYFYDELSVFEKENNNDIIIFDNSDYSIEESAKKILQIYNDTFKYK